MSRTTTQQPGVDAQASLTQTALTDTTARQTASTGGRRSRDKLTIGILRRLVVGLAATAVLLTGCASAEAPDEPPPASAGATAAPADELADEERPAADERDDEGAEDDDASEGDHLDVAVIARATADLDVHETPGDGDPFRTLPAVTDFGSTTVALVREVGEAEAEGWLEVVLPGRPNGATGWIRADAVELRETGVEVTVSLADRELTVHQDGEELLTTEVAIGDGEHPTPTGRFFVTDKLDTGDPDGAYGPYAIGLSGRSEVLTEFAGGDGQIGIHGTNDPTSIGQAVSHGCVRVPNATVRELVTLLPLGTPVVIS